MPLRPMPQAPYALPLSDDLFFTMVDEDKGDAVPISVTAAALRKLDDTATPLEIFDRYRTVLEETASNKFDRVVLIEGGIGSRVIAYRQIVGGTRRMSAPPPGRSSLRLPSDKIHVVDDDSLRGACRTYCLRSLPAQFGSCRTPQSA
jgi:hypothetical protein